MDDKVINPSGTVNLAAPPRSDGYKPVAASLWKYHILGGADSGKHGETVLRYLVVAGRRCDTAHRAIERVRVGLEEIVTMGSNHSAWPQKAHDVVGDVEVAVIATSKAVAMAVAAKKKLGAHAQLPNVPNLLSVETKRIKSIRNDIEHIEDRAIGTRDARHDKSMAKIDPLAVFDFSTIIRERKVTLAHIEISVDEEWTDLLIATRDHLVECIKAVSQARSG